MYWSNTVRPHYAGLPYFASKMIKQYDWATRRGRPWIYSNTANRIPVCCTCLWADSEVAPDFLEHRSLEQIRANTHRSTDIDASKFGQRWSEVCFGQGQGATSAKFLHLWPASPTVATFGQTWLMCAAQQVDVCPGSLQESVLSNSKTARHSGEELGESSSILSPPPPLHYPQVSFRPYAYMHGCRKSRNRNLNRRHGVLLRMGTRCGWVGRS